MAETAELDTKQEEAPTPNGHSDAWKTFESDAAFLQHIISKEPAEEELVEVPEWGVKVLCKALDGEGRIVVETQAYNPGTKTTNYSKVAHLFALYGAYNPATGNRAFSKEHEATLKDPRNGGAVARIFFPVFRLSGMLGNDVERAKKN